MVDTSCSCSTTTTTPSDSSVDPCNNTSCSDPSDPICIKNMDNIYPGLHLVSQNSIKIKCDTLPELPATCRQDLEDSNANVALNVNTDLRIISANRFLYDYQLGSSFYDIIVGNCTKRFNPKDYTYDGARISLLNRIIKDIYKNYSCAPACATPRIVKAMQKLNNECGLSNCFMTIDDLKEIITEIPSFPYTKCLPTSICQQNSNPSDCFQELPPYYDCGIRVYYPSARSIALDTALVRPLSASNDDPTTNRYIDPQLIFPPRTLGFDVYSNDPMKQKIYETMQEYWATSNFGSNNYDNSSNIAPFVGTKECTSTQDQPDCWQPLNDGCPLFNSFLDSNVLQLPPNTPSPRGINICGRVTINLTKYRFDDNQEIGSIHDKRVHLVPSFGFNPFGDLSNTATSLSEDYTIDSFEAIQSPSDHVQKMMVYGIYNKNISTNEPKYKWTDQSYLASFKNESDNSRYDAFPIEYKLGTTDIVWKHSILGTLYNGDISSNLDNLIKAGDDNNELLKYKNLLAKGVSRDFTTYMYLTSDNMTQNLVDDNDNTSTDCISSPKISPASLIGSSLQSIISSDHLVCNVSDECNSTESTPQLKFFVPNTASNTKEAINDPLSAIIFALKIPYKVDFHYGPRLLALAISILTDVQYACYPVTRTVAVSAKRSNGYSVSSITNFNDGFYTAKIYPLIGVLDYYRKLAYCYDKDIIDQIHCNWYYDSVLDQYIFKSACIAQTVPSTGLQTNLFKNLHKCQGYPLQTTKNKTVINNPNWRFNYGITDCAYGVSFQNFTKISSFSHSDCDQISTITGLVPRSLSLPNSLWVNEPNPGKVCLLVDNSQNADCIKSPLVESDYIPGPWEGLCYQTDCTPYCHNVTLTGHAVDAANSTNDFTLSTITHNLADISNIDLYQNVVNYAGKNYLIVGISSTNFILQNTGNHLTIPNETSVKLISWEWWSLMGNFYDNVVRSLSAPVLATDTTLTLNDLTGVEVYGLIYIQEKGTTKFEYFRITAIVSGVLDVTRLTNNDQPPEFTLEAHVVYVSDLDTTGCPTHRYCEPFDYNSVDPKKSTMPTSNVLSLSNVINDIDTLNQVLLRLGDRKYGTQGQLAVSEIKKIYKKFSKDPRDSGSTLAQDCYKENNCMFIKVLSDSADESPINLCDEVIEPVICINDDADTTS